MKSMCDAPRTRALADSLGIRELDIVLRAQVSDLIRDQAEKVEEREKERKVGEGSEEEMEMGKWAPTARASQSGR